MILVVARKYPAFVFERVTKRDVCDVMQEGGNANEAFGSGIHGAVSTENLHNPMSHPGGAQRMLKARMNGGGINQIGRTELSNTAQPLEFGGVDNFNFQSPEFNVPVHGIANQLPRHPTIVQDRCCAPFSD